MFCCATGSAQVPAAPAPETQVNSKTTGEIAAPDPSDGIALLKDADTSTQSEQWENVRNGYRSVRNVTNPTITPILPEIVKATGVAVIVAPGGAFHMLSIDTEGFAVARWLADRGVAAFVLKYRLQETPRDRNAYYRMMGERMSRVRTGTLDPTPVEPVQDGLAAVRLIRERADEWHVDPTKIGFLGFSAGAITALEVGLSEDAMARPDFIAPIYPPMQAREVPAYAPPMFLAIALDDNLFAQRKPLGLIDSWRNAERPLEVHLYGRGGHGFSMNDQFAAASLWKDEFYAWMKDRGLLKVQTK
jgi:dienelactone hydrolase